MNSDPRLLAYLDEYGDPNLSVEKPGVTNHYIITAVIVRPDNLGTVEATLAEISHQYFSGAEIKSSSIGSNDARRIAILEALNETPFNARVLSVDKAQLSNSGGLIYKRSFIKYLHGRLYQKLFVAHPVLDLSVDEHGSKEFMDGFVDYVNRRHVQNDLFSSHAMAYVASDKNRPLQLADLIAGSLARVLDPKKVSDNAKRILDLLRPQILSLEHWPPRMRGVVDDLDASEEQEDRIRQLSRRAAYAYLEEHYDSEHPDIRLRVEVLRFLLFRLDMQEPGTYVSTTLILEAIGETIGIEISDTVLRTNAIGPLRDAGVLIVSGPSGYKIGDRSADFRDFVAEVDRRVSPQLKRISIMRDAVKSTTLNELDILSGGYEHLSEAISAIKGST